MSISKDEELSRFRQLRRLNFFYALTVSFVTLTGLLLMFNINVEQKRLIDETSLIVQQGPQEAEEQEYRDELRLERVLERLEQVEDLIAERLESDRLGTLEDNIVGRVEELLNEQQ